METWLWGRAEGATGSSGSRVAGSTSQLLSLPGNSVLRREPTALRKLTVQKSQSGEFRERAEVGRFTSLGSFRYFFWKFTGQ